MRQTTYSDQSDIKPFCLCASPSTLVEPSCTDHAASDESKFDRELARERSRQSSFREATGYAVMQGGGESYLSAFALLLHASPFQIGMLSALPQLIGACAQLLSVKVLGRLRHRRAMILTGAATQALCWVPLYLYGSFRPTARGF